jgi:hypothetical protein
MAVPKIICHTYFATLLSRAPKISLEFKVSPLLNIYFQTSGFGKNAVGEEIITYCIETYLSVN